MSQTSNPLPLIRTKNNNLYCPPGDFYIDAMDPVAKCVITHAHSDHAREGHGEYFCSDRCKPLLKHRVGADINVTGLKFGQQIDFNGVKVSLHPAGHILGSAQVRVEYQGEVWVVTGDFKRDEDPSCEPFEVVPCDTLITEATFALPIYRWDDGDKVARSLQGWWSANSALKRPSVVFVYALGKAQRILAELKRIGETRSVYIHGAMAELTSIYRDAGIDMLDTELVADKPAKHDWSDALILAPPSCNTTAYLKRFKGCSTGFVSGWMRIRGIRRRRGFDKGFVISDHADWPALISTVKACGAKSILATHGRADIFVKYLREEGYDAAELKNVQHGLAIESE